MAPIFRGKDDDLLRRFAILTRVLDGTGLKIDAGTHGQRGYTGDYMFAWLGCTTPFGDQVWTLMAQLGSRLFFWVMDSGKTVTSADLVASVGGSQYRDRTAACREAVHAHLTALEEAHGGIRGVQWGQDSPDIVTCIAHLARLVAAMRSVPANNGADAQKTEQPWRAFNVLHNIARGHALVAGRRYLTKEDLPTVARVAVSSTPPDVRKVLPLLAHSPEGVLTVEETRAGLGVAHLDTARNALRAAQNRGLVWFEEAGSGKPATAHFRSDWAWCGAPPFRALLAGPPITN